MNSMSSHDRLIEGTSNKDELLQGFLTSIERYLECPICLGILEDTHIVPACQHRFCRKCIQESLRKCNNECPTCRVHVSTKRSLRTDDVFDSLVSALPIPKLATIGTNAPRIEHFIFHAC